MYVHRGINIRPIQDSLGIVHNTLDYFAVSCSPQTAQTQLFDIPCASLPSAENTAGIHLTKPLARDLFGETHRRDLEWSPPSVKQTMTGSSLRVCCYQVILGTRRSLIPPRRTQQLCSREMGIGG